MPNAYFISDVHLGLEAPETEKIKQRRLIAFLDRASRDASHLFILGDLFDAWIEYRTVIPKGFHRVLAKLHDVADRGVEIHFLVGNHDFWVRDYFEKEMGIKTHREAFGIELEGKKIYLHHGDGLDPRDHGYAFLKRVLRNRVSIWLFSWLHPDLGVPLARSSSRTSRDHTSTKDYGRDDGMRRAASRMIGEGYDFVIMGHRHVPREEKIGSGTYVNLGDWIAHDTYARLSGGTLSLLKWEPS
ncbi:MAG TPA: UDP-2,3-diacylglucosamine diphosphatase [Bacteroidota bacterium]|nr:UDP-2,3-diacylglucosamine diphosphatase [Bacteroidota bacterium]